MTTNSVFVIALDKTIPSEIPPLEAVRAWERANVR